MDQRFITKLKSGDPNTIRVWYTTWSPKLLNFFVAHSASEPDADELVHDTFLSCLASLPLYRGKSSLWSWMMGIARHELADYWRKLYAKKAIRALPLGEQLLEAASHESELEFGSVMHKLPEAIKELLARKYIDHQSVEEIAKELCLSAHVVQGRLYRARKMLKRLYDEEELQT